MITKRILFILGGIALFAALNAVIMLLWNLLVPEIFGFAAINFWQALGLFVLTRILFGGFRGGKIFRGGRHGENHIHEKWRKMTPEQREAFINRRKAFIFGHPFGRAQFDTHNDEESGKTKE